MVQGIRNSTHLLENLITSKTLSNKVKEWPIVNAVTKIKTCFKFFEV